MSLDRRRMHFHICCVVLGLAVSLSTAMPDQCTIPTVNHGKVGRHSAKISENNRFRECFYQLPIDDKIHDGDSVTLRCDKGYLPAESSQISKIHRLKEDEVTCKDGTWSKSLRCEAEITCGEPPTIEFATITSVFPEDYPLGVIVVYECQPGYIVKGRTTASQCLMSDDGSQAVWTKAPMSCVVPSCCDPGFVTNARRIGSDFGLNGTVKFECEEGYKLNGTGVRHCQASGMWSGKLPTCERIYCDRPSSPKNGNVSFISLEYGTELRYECNKGFNLTNHQQRHCTGNGTWSKEEPVCMEVKCDEPQAPKHGFRQLTDGLKVDSLVTYSCEEGKILVGANTSKCLSDGQWTFSPPKCADQCEVPYVQNGKVGQYELRRRYHRDQSVFVPIEEGKKVNPGETRILRCNKDLALKEGSKISEQQVTCEDGTWSVPLECKSGCSLDSINSSSTLIMEPKKDAYSFGEFVILSCPEGFKLTTEVEKLTCMRSSGWSDPLPDCKKI